jgi:hypothetical protein
MPENLKGEWRSRHLEVKGKGRQKKGTSPKGAKASGFGLTTVPWTTPDASSASWSSPVSDSSAGLSSDWE